MSSPNNSNNEGLKREIGFWEVFFLSIGGQAPFLSILTYLTAVIVLTRAFAPIIILVGTLIVLLNGLVVAFLAKRFTSTGGYFNYAFYGLSKRLGLETGMVYTFYSSLYGSAYVAGSTFLISFLLHINILIAYLISIIPSSFFLVVGIRPSSKYAIFAALTEILVFIIVIFISLLIVHFHVYNPLAYYNEKNIPITSMMLGILYAIGIPTGYGSIAPVSGEIKKAERNVGRAAIGVIITGGSLTSLVAYSLINLSIINGHISSLIYARTSILFEIINLLGTPGFFIILFTIVNDGILATLAFMLASSRNLYAMSIRNLIPTVFSKLRYSNPIMASFLTIIIYVSITFPLISLVGAFRSFLILGAMAGMGNLFIHISANFSLIKINIDSMIRRLNEIITGTVAQVLSFTVLIYSIVSTSPVVAYTFLGFLILAFIYTEVISMNPKRKSILS